MGIVHFAPVGTSPGAVTSALAYLKQHPELMGEARGGIIQDVVIFCSYDVYEGSRSAERYVWNSYGRVARRQGWQERRGSENTIEIIKQFLGQPADDPLLPPKGRLYVWPVDVNDYEACFETIAKATLAVARSDDTGKYVWSNLTGGTNILNSALMQVASLSRLIGRMYYTFIARDGDRKYLQPASREASEYDFRFVPLVKTHYDLSYYRVLEILYQEPTTWIKGRDLLARLKGVYPTEFDKCKNKDEDKNEDIDFDHFKNQYLNRMTGDVLDEDRDQSREGDRPIRINQTGIDLVDYLHLNDLVQELVNRVKSQPDLVKRYQAELQEYQIPEWWQR